MSRIFPTSISIPAIHQVTRTALAAITRKIVQMFVPVFIVSASAAATSAATSAGSTCTNGILNGIAGTAITAATATGVRVPVYLFKFKTASST